MFYYVHQKIYTGGTYGSGRDDSACHIDGAFLFYRNTDPDNSLRGNMDRLPLRDAARGLQDISIKSVSLHVLQRLSS